jgi:hypothetical protein
MSSVFPEIAVFFNKAQNAVLIAFFCSVAVFLDPKGTNVAHFVLSLSANDAGRRHFSQSGVLRGQNSHGGR